MNRRTCFAGRFLFFGCYRPRRGLSSALQNEGTAAKIKSAQMELANRKQNPPPSALSSLALILQHGIQHSGQCFGARLQGLLHVARLRIQPLL